MEVLAAAAAERARALKRPVTDVMHMHKAPLLWRETASRLMQRAAAASKASKGARVKVGKMRWLWQQVCDAARDDVLVKATTCGVGDEVERLRAWLQYQRRADVGCCARAASTGSGELVKPPEEGLWNAVARRAKAAASPAKERGSSAAWRRVHGECVMERQPERVLEQGGEAEFWHLGLDREVGRVEFHAAGALPTVPRLTAKARRSAQTKVAALEFGLVCGRRPRYSLERLRALVLRTEDLFGVSPLLRQRRGAKSEITRPMRLRLRVALQAVGGWQMMTKKRLRRVIAMQPGSERQLLEMRKVELGTITASTSYILVIVVLMDDGSVVLRFASAQVYATLLGVPLQTEFCVRRCLAMRCKASTETRRRAAAGQSLDYDITLVVLRLMLRDVIESGVDVSMVETHAGISMFAAALVTLVGAGKVRVLVSSEVVRLVKDMHRAGFGDMTDTYCMLSYEADTVEHMRAVRGRAHLAAAGIRCTAVSDANGEAVCSAKRQGWLERSLEENAATIAALLAAEPLRVVLETSAAVLHPSLAAWWGRMQVCVTSHEQYEWRYVVACPRALLRKEPPRRRIFILGWRLPRFVHPDLQRFAGAPTWG